MLRLRVKCYIFVADLWHCQRPWSLKPTVNCILIIHSYFQRAGIGRTHLVAYGALLVCRVQVYLFLTCSKLEGIKELKIFWGCRREYQLGKPNSLTSSFYPHHAAQGVALGRHWPVFTRCIDGLIDRQMDSRFPLLLLLLCRFVPLPVNVV